MAYLIANAQVWDGESDDRYPADVLVERNRVSTVARGHGQLKRDGVAALYSAKLEHARVARLRRLHG